MPAPGSVHSRLLRHDCRIAINTARATLAGWHDRLIAATLLLGALAVLRSSITDHSWTVAARAALCGGITVGICGARLVSARLAFHASDGLLASDALHPPTRRRYILAWHSTAVAMLAAITLLARPSLLIVSVGGYLAGVLVAGLTKVLKIPARAVGRTRLGWDVRARLHGPIAGVGAAMILLLSLLPARSLGAHASLAIVGVETVLFAVALTIVDDSVVRFLTIAGHGAGRIVFYHAKPLVPFVALAAPVCWLALGPVAAGIAGAASVMVALLLSLRILAYRVHGRRFADLLVSICSAVLVLVAYSMPITLPPIAVAILWQLWRRGAAKAWLLA